MNVLVKHVKKRAFVSTYIPDINVILTHLSVNFRSRKHISNYSGHWDVEILNLSKRVLLSNKTIPILCWSRTNANAFYSDVIFYTHKRFTVEPLYCFGWPYSSHRNKSTKKIQKRPEYDSDSDSDIDEDLPRGTKIINVRLQSLRMDGILKRSFNIARNKVESAFYEDNIRLNGNKPNKKSVQLKIGDEVDLIKGLSPMNPEYLNVSRVEMISVKEGEDNVEEMQVKLKVFKTLYIENYDTCPWKPGTNE